MAPESLKLSKQESSWVLEGRSARSFALINDYLGYLVDRAYSPRTVEAYAFDLLSFARWLVSEKVALEKVTTDVVVRYLAACRRAPVRGRQAATCTPSVTGPTAASHRPLSTDGWRRSRGCSAIARCSTLRRETRSRGVKKHAERPTANAPVHSVISGTSASALGCAYASRGGFLAHSIETSSVL